jgi:hypothetical protein
MKDNSRDKVIYQSLFTKKLLEGGEFQGCNLCLHMFSSQ